MNFFAPVTAYPVLACAVLLTVSNLFMTFAWYGHLKHLQASPWWTAALVSWGIALFEYLLQVPANRIGYTVLSLAQLKILQEVITLTVFVPFAVVYMNQPVKLDFLWAGMDMRMALTAPQAMSMLSGMPTLAMPMLGANHYLRVDFADGSQFTGDATGYGAAAKVGALYRLTPRVRFGAVYHAEPELGDLESHDASLSFGDMTTGMRMGSVDGKVKVHDFRWPAMLGGGVSVDATERITLSMDVKRIYWEDVMKSMDLTFTADGGGSVSMSLPQAWEDQTVWCFGISFKATDALTLRAGYNYGENPVPESNVNPMFPAIVEHHHNGGASYQVDDRHSIHLSLVHVPETEATSAAGITSTHSQFNGQVMYSYLF